MSYTPRVATSPCGNCGSTGQKVKHKHLLSRCVRLECRCGISGAWVECLEIASDPWNYAISGWEKIFPVVFTSPSPRPRRI